MKPGAFFINTSRAEVVDQAALEPRRPARKASAPASTSSPRSPPGGSGDVKAPIFELPGVIGTHHIGASTDQAQEAIAAETVRIVREYQETGRAPNVVNLARKSPATHLLVVRHYDRVGVLAAVFDASEASRHQRPGDGEHRLRRREGGGRPHPPEQSADSPEDARLDPHVDASDIIELSLAGVVTVDSRQTSTVTEAHDRTHLQLRSRARRSCPSPSSQEAQRDLMALPGVGMSVLEISHRSQGLRRDHPGLRGGHPQARGDPRRLPGPLPPGRRLAPVLDGADEPAARRRQGRLHRHGLLVEEGRQGSEEVRNRADRRLDGGRQLQPRSRPVGAEARPRAPPTSTSPRTRRSTASSGRHEPQAGSVPLVCDASSDIFSRPIDVSRYAPDLRRRAEEPRALGRHARDPARRPARARPRRTCRRCSTTRPRRRRSPSTTRRRSSASTSCGSS